MIVCKILFNHGHRVTNGVCRQSSAEQLMGRQLRTSVDLFFEAGEAVLNKNRVQKYPTEAQNLGHGSKNTAWIVRNGQSRLV